MQREPRRLALVRQSKSWAQELTSASLPFIDDQPLVFLGEVPNMPGHGVFAGSKSGRIYTGFHIEQFEEVPPDDL